MDQLEATGRLPAAGRAGPAGQRPERGLPPAARQAMAAAAVVVVAATVVIALWAVDTSTNRDRVARNVNLGGIDIGRMAAPELAAAVATLAATYADAQVVVEAEGGGFEAGAPELGLSVVQDRTAAQAMEVGRKGFFLSRIWGWARSFVADRPAPLTVTVNEGAVAEIVAERDPKRTDPTEPTLAVKGGRVTAVAGRPGRGISPPSVRAALKKAGPKGLPLRISVDRAALPPRFDLEEAEGLAARAEQIASGGLPVTAGPASATIPADVLRRWFRTEVTDAGLRLGVEPQGAQEVLAELFPNPVVAPVDAGFAVSGSRVSITPAKPGTACCGPEAPAQIRDALLNRPGSGAVSLALKSVPAKRDEDAARKLQIVEPIGTFTTNHAPGEPRVRNIHRIADLIQGAVIEPGATFSVNNYVGPRTTAKGFVSAPIIDENYNFTDDVGGGISQFATTIFNAAFFGGLDITSYYMHGIYISRYPYGRESTISFPAPDVRIRNNTPYGVLIWPTYTETSITVTLYSTKYVSGEQTNQTTEPRGACTAVTTERTRTYLDGRKTVDKFSGVYSPKEGEKCE